MPWAILRHPFRADVSRSLLEKDDDRLLGKQTVGQCAERNCSVVFDRRFLSLLVCGRIKGLVEGRAAFATVGFAEVFVAFAFFAADVFRSHEIPNPATFGATGLPLLPGDDPFRTDDEFRGGHEIIYNSGFGFFQFGSS